jgi:hypothetical protein
MQVNRVLTGRQSHLLAAVLHGDVPDGHGERTPQVERVSLPERPDLRLQAGHRPVPPPGQPIKVGAASGFEAGHCAARRMAECPPGERIRLLQPALGGQPDGGQHRHHGCGGTRCPRRRGVEVPRQGDQILAAADEEQDAGKWATRRPFPGGVTRQAKARDRGPQRGHRAFLVGRSQLQPTLDQPGRGVPVQLGRQLRIPAL